MHKESRTKISIHSPQFLQELGSLVINAGLVESSLRSVILTLCQKNDLAKRLVYPRLSMTQKIEMLQRIVHTEIDDTNKKPWEKLLREIDKLFQFRNQVFHGMPGMKGDEIFLFSVKKGKNGIEDVWKESRLVLEDLEKKNYKLSTIHRQMMDFIEDYPIEEGGSLKRQPQSQKNYPRLIGNILPISNF